MTMTQLLPHYQRGMDVLFVSSPIFAEFSLGLGVPVSNTSIPTAQVEWDPRNKRITFVMNPNFLANLTDEEVGAIIAHETYHVLLEHLTEMLDESYKVKNALINAHECIINDGLASSVGVELPDMALRGTELYDQDFSLFSTQEGYDFIVEKMKEKKEEEEKNDEGEDSGSGDEDGEGSQGGDSGADTDDESGDKQEGGSCGGVHIDPDDLNDFLDAVEKAAGDIASVIDENDVPDELLDQLSSVVPGDGWNSSSGPKPNLFAPAVDEDENFNWKRLLAKINPKVMSSGRRRIKETWQRPRRKLIASYPEIILPDMQYNKPDDKGKGDALPTLVIALDLSGSIPRHLVNDLVALMDSIPHELISPRGATWSDYLVTWNPEERALVGAYGTNIGVVYSYAAEVAIEIGTEPYVLVITDGQFGVPSSMDKNLVNRKWFWCGINNSDVIDIRKNIVSPGYTTDERVYRLSDFRG